MAFNRKQTVIHLHGQEASGVKATDLKKGEIIIVHPAAGKTAQFGTLDNTGNNIVWFQDYATTKAYVDAEVKKVSDRVTALEGLTGITNSALQSIEKGTDGSYVTTTIGAKTKNKQSVGVAVTVGKVSGETATEGLAEATEVRSYVDSKVSTVDGKLGSGFTADSTVTSQLAAVKATADTALQSISAGDKKDYVTVSVSDKGNGTTQKISVELTTQTISEAGDTSKGVAEASDVKAYIGGIETSLQGGIDAINTKLGNVEKDAQVNKIEKIKRNNELLTIADKTVNIEVPTKASEITFDGTHANTGFTGNDVKAIVESIEKNILDNEKTTSASLTELNTRIDNLPAATVTGVATDDKVLSLTDKLVATTISLDYGDATSTALTGKKVIKLIGKNNTVISEIDASEFVKDGMLTNAELVTDPSGQEPGTYIHLVWNTDGGNKSMYVNVTSLIDIYTAKKDSGLTLTDHEFGIDTAIIATKASVDTLSTTVGNYTVNGKKISSNPVLGAVDIKVSENETVADAITTLKAKNVSATGDTYVSATAASNKVTVAATEKLTGAVGKAESAVQSVSVKNTETNNITATKNVDSKNVEFDFDSMIIDCGTF